MIFPQSQFPYLEEFKDKFPITEKTIFAYKEIYSDYELTYDLLVHEEKHLKQQKKIGADEWIKLYLNDDKFRFKQEVEAYIAQLESIKDRNERSEVRQKCARNLSSELYGSIISLEEAFRILL